MICIGVANSSKVQLTVHGCDPWQGQTGSSALQGVSVYISATIVQVGKTSNYLQMFLYKATPLTSHIFILKYFESSGTFNPLMLFWFAN